MQLDTGITAIACSTAVVGTIAYLFGYLPYLEKKKKDQLKHILYDTGAPYFNNHDQTMQVLYENVFFTYEDNLTGYIFTKEQLYLPSPKQLKRELNNKSGVAVLNYNLFDFLTVNTDRRRHHVSNILTPKMLVQIIERGKNK